MGHTGLATRLHSAEPLEELEWNVVRQKLDVKILGEAVRNSGKTGTDTCTGLRH